MVISNPRWPLYVKTIDKSSKTQYAHIQKEKQTDLDVICAVDEKEYPQYTNMLTHA